MGWAIYEGTSDPDPTLDRYRDAIATLAEDGEVVGYLVTEVGLSITFTGRRRLRPVWSRGEEISSWIVLEVGPNSPYGDLESITPSDLANDLLVARAWRGGPYELRWLAGEEFVAAWAKYEADCDE